MRVAVLITCFNRKTMTLSILSQLSKIQHPEIDSKIYIVDGGSYDGTQDEILSCFPKVWLFQGKNLYWCEGMRIAWVEALKSHFDYFLLVNDDVILKENFWEILLGEISEHKNPENYIYVGRVLDPVTDAVIYGALVRVRGFRSLKFQTSTPPYQVEPDKFNCNFTLVSRSIVQTIGILSEGFRHSFGDIDYGLRAKKSGIGILELRESVGYNSGSVGLQKSVSRIAFKNYRSLLNDPKGVPITEWLLFYRRHGGALWYINFLGHYLKLILSSLKITRVFSEI